MTPRSIDHGPDVSGDCSTSLTRSNPLPIPAKSNNQDKISITYSYSVSFQVRRVFFFFLWNGA